MAGYPDSFLSRLAAMSAPSSVKARGKTGEYFRRLTWSQIVTTSAFCSAVNQNRKFEVLGLAEIEFLSSLAGLIPLPAATHR
jgi:hypothetical protein